MFQFANPELLWLLTVIIPLVAYYIYHLRGGRPTITISDTSSLTEIRKTAKYYLRHIPFILECVSIVLMILALARPQNSEQGSKVKTEGIDIVLAIDVSGSMLARDFNPDRITAAKEVAGKFIVDRTNDRIGIVVFAGESFTQSPLTTDKSTLLTLLGQIKSGVLEDGTAIGNGLATAINRLKESTAKSKVVILLTDGVNNMGQVAPITAAELAESYGIKVYTIGVGSRGMAPYPAYDIWGNMVYQQVQVEIDEDILTQIAQMTGGEYFRAVDNKSLSEIYSTINKLEKTQIETDDFVKYNELFGTYMLWAILALVCSFLSEKLWLKQIP